MLSGTLTPLSGQAAEEHPLGYYVLLWMWMKVFGGSLVGTRLLSIGAGLIVVYLVYLLALEMLQDEKIAQLSMLFSAFAPFQVHYAQEIRMYSFLAMWLLLATYAYQRGSKTGNWKWWMVFSVAAALAQYTHNLAAFYLIALAILPILQRDWKTVRSTVFAGLGALILYTPWLFQLPAQFSKIQTTYWVERPDLSDLFTLILVYLSNTPLPAGTIAAVLGIGLIIVLLGIIQTMRHRRRTGTHVGLWLFYLSFALPLFLFIFSQWRPVYIERALLPSGAIFCIWLAWVITKTGLPAVARYSLLAMLAFSSTLGIYQHVTYDGAPYGPFQELDRSLRERFKPQDVIVHSNKLSMLPAILFDRNLPQSFIGDPPGSKTDTLAPATQQVFGIREEQDIQSATQGAGRVWFIIYERSIAEYQAAGYETHPDIEFLDAQFNRKLQENWDGLQVFLYAQEP